MAFYLRKVRTFFENAGLKSKEIVLSVPQYATNAERQAYLDAAEIAGIKCIRLINESTACALTYGFFRKADLDVTKPRKVVFVDFGHSKLTCTYAEFLKGKMKILFTSSNRNLGARQIDFQLFELLSAEFEKKHGCDPRENPRCRLRLLDSIEKMRKLLTSNKEADVICEALMEDQDLKKHFSREDLEKIIEPTMRVFRQSLEDFVVKSGK
jgi:heat shock protein 4